MAVKLKLKKKIPSPSEDTQTNGEKEWFFIHEGVQYGPVTDAGLCAAADGGLIAPSDEVWRTHDMDHRIKASSVDDLFPESDRTERVSGEDVEGKISSEAVGFQPKVVSTGSLACPYCWYRFDPEGTLFIARHPELKGDPILGADESQRFMPSRFTPDGHAIDAGGVICPDMACPHCHMRIPRSIVSMPPLFLSIVGAPASGKSYFLASMCWRLRTTLKKDFSVRFTDADGVTNRWLNDYEERLFMQTDEESFQLINKTELQGDLYREVVLNGLNILLPKPSVFSLQAEEGSIYHEASNEAINRSLVLYDNAGEHFQPGEDSASQPGTQHLSYSEAIFFLFDPTKDPQFRKLIKDSKDQQLSQQHLVQRQDILLTEMINRVRLYRGLDATHRYEKPIVVIVSKADVLGDSVRALLDDPPWKWDKEIQAHSLDVGQIHQVSYTIRALLEQYAPQVVNTLDSFASDVLYMPVSALGHSPSPDPRHQGSSTPPLVVRPCDVKPKWVEAPILYILFKLGFISGISHRQEAHPLPEEVSVRGQMFHFIIPGTQARVTLPLSYAGFSLQCPKTGIWFRVPDNAEIQ